MPDDVHKLVRVFAKENRPGGLTCTVVRRIDCECGWRGMQKYPEVDGSTDWWKHAPDACNHCEADPCRCQA